MRIIILGTGSMASHHATHFADLDGVEVVAGVDTNPERLQSFCDGHNIKERFASVDTAIAWGEFDAVANVTPDAAHHPTTMACLAAGKHVFCEKPLAVNHPDALEMAERAEREGLVGMVNLSYRNVAEIHAAREYVTSGQIGNVRHVEASYLQSWLVSKNWGDWRTEPRWLWRLSKEHGSNGVLGDVGIHILDFVSFGTASDISDVTCRLKTFHKADGDQIGDYRLDANDSCVMTAEFGNGALGVIHATRFATGHLNDLRLRIYGDKGAVEVKHGLQESELHVCLGEDIDRAIWRKIEVQPVETNFQRFARAVRSGQTEEPSFAHTAELQRILDIGMASETGPSIEESRHVA